MLLSYTAYHNILRIESDIQYRNNYITISHYINISEIGAKLDLKVSKLSKNTSLCQKRSKLFQKKFFILKALNIYKFLTELSPSCITHKKTSVLGKQNRSIRALLFLHVHIYSHPWSVEVIC